MNDSVTLLKDRRSSNSKAPRLLLISYHFPPGQATGALRWQQLAAFGVDRGWEIDVITRHPEELPTLDATRLAQLPDGIRVFGVRSSASPLHRWEGRLTRLLSKLKPRSNAVAAAPLTAAKAREVPRAPELDWRQDLRWSVAPRALRRIYHAWRFFGQEWDWARAAQRVAVSLPDNYNAIASCGPPHVPHIAASNAARLRSVPFIMDMRDPWSLTPALPREIASRFWYHTAESYERTAVGRAALVVANTGLHAKELRKLYPDAASRIIAVMNGCDDDRVATVPNDRFTLSYAGNIYIDRDPRILFRAAAKLVQREQLTPDQFALELIGHVDQFGGVSVQELARQEGLADYLSVHPRLPRGEALRLMARAAVLVSLPQDVDLAIPSKVFEYTQFPAWVLALANPGSATEEVLRGSGADVVSPEDEEAIVQALQGRWREFTSTGRPRPINADGRFSRSRQAAIMFEAIERCLPHFRSMQERAA